MARRTSKKSTSKKRTPSKSKQPTRQPLLSEISPERRMDIVGIVLLVIGLLTLLSLFTQSSGKITGWWVTNISKVIGWGGLSPAAGVDGPGKLASIKER